MCTAKPWDIIISMKTLNCAPLRLGKTGAEMSRGHVLALKFKRFSGHVLLVQSHLQLSD